MGEFHTGDTMEREEPLVRPAFTPSTQAVFPLPREEESYRVKENIGMDRAGVRTVSRLYLCGKMVHMVKKRRG